MTDRVEAPVRCGFIQLPAARRSQTLLWRDSFGAPPFLEQRLAAARIALVGEFQCGDAVGAEMAIVTAQFAPRCDDADAIEKRQRKRPHRAPGLRAVLVNIGDGELAFGSDGLTDRREL